ncbi:hypothetical protein Tco_1307391 [Tanacetum coccineum]
MFRDNSYRGEHRVISGSVPKHLVSLWYWQILFHEVVYDDFGESWIRHVVVLLRVLVLDLIYQGFPYMAKISNKRENFLFKWRIFKFLTWEIRADLEHVSEVVNINSMAFSIYLKVKKMMMDGDSGPELLHVDFWYISSDLKCVVEGIEFQSI